MRRYLNVVVGVLALLVLSGSTYVRNWYDVVDYGARGNDTVDDSEIINRCITAASSVGGGTVYIPQGRFFIREPLKLVTGVHIKGAGVQACSLQSLMVDNQPVFVTDSLVTVRDWSISGMTIRGNWQWTDATPPDSSNQHGIYIVTRGTEDSTYTAIDHFEIKNVVIMHMCGSGIVMDTEPDQCADGTVNCHFTNYGRIDNVQVDYCGSNPVYMRSRNIFHLFHNCRFDVRYITSHALKVKKGNWYWIPSVYIEDQREAADSWGYPNGIYFEFCALQQKETAYSEPDCTSSAGIYLKNPRYTGTHMDMCWLEGRDGKRFLAAIIDTTEAYSPQLSFAMTNCQVSYSDSCMCLVDVARAAFKTFDVSRNSPPGCGTPYIQGIFGDTESQQPMLLYEQSESTYVYWNGARWDTLSHNLLD